MLACVVLLTACLPPSGPTPTATPRATPPSTPTGAPTALPSPPASLSPLPATPTAVASPSATPLPTATSRPPTQPPAPGETPPPTPSPAAVNKRGVHLLLDDGDTRFSEAVWEQHIVWTARLTGQGGYAVQLIRSNDLRPASWQHMIDLMDREGVVPIIRLATFKSPDGQWWTTPTPDPDGRGYKSAADRYRRFFDAIDWRAETVLVTVANEVNRPDEWGGAPDPAAYARFLRDVTDALRRVTSVNVLVLNGALDAYAPSASFGTTYAIDSERFMEGMVAEVPDIFERLDGWASHAYPLGPFGEHPGQQAFKIDDVRPNAGPRPQPPAGVVNRGVNGYVWELWKLRQLGLSRELPVYVTESGWRHRATQAPSRDKDFAVVEDDRFAELVQLAYDGPPDGSPAGGWTPWNQDPHVRAVALFALAGRPDHWGHTNLLLTDTTGLIQGAYTFAEALERVSPGSIARQPRASTAPR
ncbi:MAG: hypothetical protein IT306_17890 [Chloroflexi bacterium]|nr:hypothetical protein [Chloroflexota bacterium]